MKKCTVLFLFFAVHAHAQLSDTLNLQPVNINSYFKVRPVFSIPSSVSIIDSGKLQLNSESMLPAVNTVPGVRMEQRSPGSYRLSIRGSALRSPFGVRNVKVYMDDFPLTDAGGNTYLNLVDVNAFNKLEILKGPDGSLFGANSAGVVRLGIAEEVNQYNIHAGVMAGSFGLMNENVGVAIKNNRNILSIKQSWLSADGYRVNSALTRHYVQLHYKLNYATNANLQFLFIYGNLKYKTPGGLTLAQYTNDPEAARPATPTTPGAVEQHAGIYNQTVYGGIKHTLQISNAVKNVMALFASYTDFKNPFITNYEKRREQNAGFKTWFEVDAVSRNNISLNWNTGIEAQVLYSPIDNFKNNGGEQGAKTAGYEFNPKTGFAFTQISAVVHRVITIDGSVSYNFNSISYQNKFPADSAILNRQFKAQLMPRIGLSWLVSQMFVMRATVSRGYSTPTLAEIYPSSGLNTALQPEIGWNYEAGYRVKNKRSTVNWDVNMFYYQLNNTITRRENGNGVEYFINAGKTNQPGIESELNAELFNRTGYIIPKITLYQATTYNDFKFKTYRNADDDFSGNHLTGTPQWVIVNGITLNTIKNFELTAQYSYTSSIPLNDANTDNEDAFDVVLLKAGKKFYTTKTVFNLQVGIDNLFDTKYSLGNDLNAFGGRYYNAAAERNYFVSLAFKLRK